MFEIAGLAEHNSSLSSNQSLVYLFSDKLRRLWRGSPGAGRTWCGLQSRPTGEYFPDGEGTSGVGGEQSTCRTSPSLPAVCSPGLKEKGFISAEINFI